MQPIKIIAFLSLLLVPIAAYAQVPGVARLQNDGKVVIFNYHANECREIQYRAGNRYLPEGIKSFSELLRSRGDGSTSPIDVRLIELIDHIQDHFGADSVEIISGFRSQGYNQSLRDAGRGAARESLHTKGLALDIHLDEVDEQELFDYLKSLKRGGAGYYPRYLFVHADVGDVRTWQEAPPKERVLIGTENNPNAAWSAVTDRNTYQPGNEMKVAIRNNDYKSQHLNMNFWIEHFRRGEWKDQQTLVKEHRSLSLDPNEATTWHYSIPEDMPLGKYRLVIFANKDLSIAPVYSNEFYVRKAMGTK